MALQLMVFCALVLTFVVQSTYACPWARNLNGRSLQQAAACSASRLGYQCSWAVCGRVRLHWTVGGQAPDGHCAYISSQPQATPARNEHIHIAVQTDIVSGFVAASFAKQEAMAPADAVIGSAGASGPLVKAYSIKGYSSADVMADASIQLNATGLLRNATTLTMCFTRDVAQVGRAGVAVPLTAAGVLMNFAVSDDIFKSRNKPHLFSSMHLCRQRVRFTAPAAGEAQLQDDGAWYPSDEAGWQPDEAAGLHERIAYMRDHGALMFTGWVALAPAGVMAARHKWLFARREGLWFQVHRAVQLISSLLVTVGFILPFTSFVAYEEQHGAKEAGLTSIHKALGITIMSGLGCHILLTLLRPKPDHERRWVWNLAHWWLGRGVWALALANVGIGIALWRRATGGSGAEWIIPLVALALGYFVLHLFLVRKGRLAAQYESPSGGLAKGLPSSSEMAQVSGGTYGRMP